MSTFLWIGIAGAILGFVLAWFNPYFSKEDKDKIRAALEKGEPCDVVDIKLRHRFSTRFVRLVLPTVFGFSSFMEYYAEAALNGDQIGVLVVLGSILILAFYVTNLSLSLGVFGIFADEKFIKKFIKKDEGDNEVEIIIRR